MSEVGAALSLFSREGNTSSHGELKLALSRLVAESERRSRTTPSPESLAFFSSLLSSLQRIRGRANLDLRIECLFSSGTYLFNNGYLPASLAVIRHLDELGKKNQDPLWARKIEQFAGVISADLGDIAEAVTRHSKALRIAQQVGHLLGEVSSLSNMGAALVYGGLYKEAVACLSKSVDLTQSEDFSAKAMAQGFGDRRLECGALNNLAQAYYHLDDNRTALQTINECLRLSPEPIDSWSATNRILREFTYVRVALDLGLIREARKHTERCVNYAGLAGARGHFITGICRGLCEVYAGDVNAGLSILERSLDESGDRISSKTAALLALAKAMEQVNQPERALVYMERLIGQIVRAREDGIRALLSHHSFDPTGPITAESEDLQKLRLTHANLRAAAAEHRVVHAHQETLERLAITADLKEEASGGHGHRVGRLSSLFARELGWTKDACHSLELAGRLHDIGKIGLPDRLMLKSEALRETERQFISAHTKIGAEILASGVGEPLRMAQEVARFHHEHWDGEGYPAKIAGTRIPIHARIIALADVFDALTHGRPYSEAWPIERALEEISSRVGKQFDPEIGERFVLFVRDLQARHGDIDRYLGQSAQNTAFSQARQRIQALLREEPAPEVAESGMSVA